MLRGRERAKLKSIANGLKPVFQIGKGGINNEFITQIDDYLEKNEIVKIKILNNSDELPDESANFLMEELNAEFVQSIGSTFTIYRASKKNRRIEL